MDTYFRTINDNSPVLLSDRFVALAEKCLSLSRSDIFRHEVCHHDYQANRITYLPSPDSFKLGVPDRFQFPMSRTSMPHDDYWDLPRRINDFDEDVFDVFSDIRHISQVMLTILQGIQIRLRRRESYATDPLGEYHYRGEGYNHAPFIVLFPEEIENCAKAFSGMSIELLAAKTLIHELAHAFLDPNNWNFGDKYSDNYRKYVYPFGGTPTDFYRVREESMANIITYRIFYLAAQTKAIPRHFEKKVKAFILLQEAPYSLSLHMLPTPCIFGWIQAKSNNLIDEESALKWMEEADVLMQNDTLLNQYHESILPKERALGLPWADEREKSLLFNKYGDSIIDPWGTGNSTPPPELEQLFHPNHLIKRMDRYCLYDKSWNLIMEFPCDYVKNYSVETGLILLIEESVDFQITRCRDKNGVEQPIPKSWL